MRVIFIMALYLLLTSLTIRIDIIKYHEYFGIIYCYLLKLIKQINYIKRMQHRQFFNEKYTLAFHNFTTHKHEMNTK